MSPEAVNMLLWFAGWTTMYLILRAAFGKVWSDPVATLVAGAFLIGLVLFLASHSRSHKQEYHQGVTYHNMEHPEGGRS